MIPIYLDPARTRIALIGRGELAERRLRWLRDAGAEVELWSDALPQSESDLALYHVVWIADLEPEESRKLAEAARAAGVLVNVEDNVPLCDFHTPALVRRGRLTLSVGTGGASPAVARAVRERLEEVFPEDWTEALEEIARARDALRANGATTEILIADARERLHARNLI
ncbi:MAG: bifunctional precorrin-2 dehydrogenase/sirohydrochlorin ferrochelatase [Hyphomonadaceae bacterium]